ncbi:MAG: hypothetical protein JSV79_10490 [Armatimonadota bacterium]|nr:MAG: hypothetical protein JSV79_10490 [Armatimonadota bacterium]
MSAQGKTTNRAGRRVGALIFAVGLIMLVVVFALAAAAFQQIPAALGADEAGSGPGLGSALAAIGARAAFLLVMAYASSLLASKGLDLYQAARGDGGE